MSCQSITLTCIFLEIQMTCASLFNANHFFLVEIHTQVFNPGLIRQYGYLINNATNHQAEDPCIGIFIDY